jgi:hypothetical protein
MRRALMNRLGSLRRSAVREFRDGFLIAEWNLGIAKAPPAAFLTPGVRPEVRWFPPVPEGRYRADPFPLTYGGRTYIFYEDYDWETDKGVIACVEFRDGRPLEPRVVLDLSVHASYPYVLEHEGQIYCIPETYRAGEVALYRARAVPHDWVKDSTLIREPAIDSTVFRHDDTWWLACTIHGEGSESDLHLWYADELRGPWEPHPRNPVKTDPRSARPAGPPFIHEGHLYRPAQDCSETYGGKVVISRVETLSRTEFREVLVSVVDPFPRSPCPDGLHTLSGMGVRTVLDGKRWVFTRHAKTYAFKPALEERWLPRLRGALRRP